MKPNLSQEQECNFSNKENQYSFRFKDLQKCKWAIGIAKWKFIYKSVSKAKSETIRRAKESKNKQIETKHGRKLVKTISAYKELESEYQTAWELTDLDMFIKLC